MKSRARDKRTDRAPARFGQRSTWLLGLLLAVVTAVAYSNSFAGGFHFDDRNAIEENLRIRTLWPPSVPMSATSRPVGMLSFAANYALHGFEVWGYHAVNLCIHVAAGLVLFGIVRRTLGGEALTAKYQRSADGLAVVIALIWLVHPLNTQAVTYLVQRFESLMGLCYLATLYCFIRAQQLSSGRRWYIASIMCCAIGMGTKEVMVTAPIMTLWYDRAFVAKSWRSLWQARWSYYAALASTWLVLAQCMLALQLEVDEGNIARVDGLTPLNYLLSQASVITHYLRLCFWPVGLCLDYGWPVAKSAQEVVAPLALIGGLFALTVWAAWRRPRWGFVGGWFFFTLAPTSSVVPIRDLAFDHRMYLALIAVVTTTVLAGNLLVNRLLSELPARRLPLVKAALAMLVIATLAALSWSRNQVYASDLDLWQDTVERAPNNARAHMNLAAQLRTKGRYDEAFQHAQQALELDRNSAEVQTRFGAALVERGDVDGALPYLRRAVELKPNDDEAHCNLAVALWKLDKRDEANQQFKIAIGLAPAVADLYNNFAKALAESGDVEQALGHYQTALEIRPQDPELYYNTGVALQSAQRFAGAERYYRQTIELAPQHEPARNNLGITLVAQGKFHDAIEQFMIAVELAPQLAIAHQNLGLAYAQTRQIDKAIHELRIALQIDPELPIAAAQLKNLTSQHPQ